MKHCANIIEGKLFKAHESDAGYDLYNAENEDIVVKPCF